MEDIAQERGPGYRYSRRATLPLIRQLSVVPNWRNALLLALQWAVMIAACVIAIRSLAGLSDRRHRHRHADSGSGGDDA